MFVVVVRPAEHRRVALVGRADVAIPLVDVVDLAPGGGQLAPGVLTMLDQQLGGLAGAPGEQPLAATEVDDDSIGVDHGSADVPGEGSAQHVVRVERHAVGRFAHPALGPAEIDEEVVRLVDGETGERVDRSTVEVGCRTEPRGEQHPPPRRSVDGDVDEWLGSGADVANRLGRAEDRDQGVEATLAVSARE